MPSETRDREAEGHARLKHDGPRRRDRSADSSAVVSGRRAPVCRQDAVHDVLVDIDPERLRDDARHTRVPNRGLRDWSATMARMRASLGPGGPGFFGRWPEENNRRYVRRTHA